MNRAKLNRPWNTFEDYIFGANSSMCDTYSCLRFLFVRVCEHDRESIGRIGTFVELGRIENNEECLLDQSSNNM